MGTCELEEQTNNAKQEINGDVGVPICSMSIDMNLPPLEMEAQVRDLCRTLIKRWSCLPDSYFKVETVSGGITNVLLKVSVSIENEEDNPITVRVFGPNTEIVIDRQRELMAITYLSAAGFGAKLLGVFANGMVQSFIDACTLAPTDMSKPKLAAEIARQLRKFHQMEVPGPKDPQLWPDIFKFLDTASNLKFEDSVKQAKYASISFNELKEEASFLKVVTDSLNAPVVFAHNDLLSGNLMLNEKEEKLYLIDFEYGSYNFRGFDIGNHFNEYAGFECDYNLYPDKDTQYHFFRYYLSPDNPESVLESELEQIYVETNCYALASHLYWAFWAIVQAKYSPIDFDYLSYHFLRYNEYKKQKDCCISLARSFLSKSS
uniref:ethanolamine kinase n=1 Tax=Araucaria cunninghamii TaxID=56994 RepID=A0A0D6QUT0_ARACU